jgi:hypothetical protein
MKKMMVDRCVCGRKGEVVRSGDRFYVECTKCGKRTHSNKTVGEAVQEWHEMLNRLPSAE